MNFSTENLKKNVQSEFNKIREAINVREQLLLRQLDVICNSNQSYLNKNNIAITTTKTVCTTHDLNNSNGNLNSYNNINSSNNIDEIKFISDIEILLSLIRNFGKFNLENVNVNFTNLLYMNEDEPEHDTPTMVKCLENITKMTNVTITTPSPTNRTDDTNEDIVDYNDENIDVTKYLNGYDDEEKIVIDFSNNRKIITQNVSNLNESVINITLNEAKELIEKSSNILQPLELLGNDKQCAVSNEHSKSITPVSQVKSILPSSSSTSNLTKTTVESKKQRKSLKLKPKITINNCNGVINLKNISSLTINCANKDLMNVSQNESQSEPIIESGDSIAESQQIYSVTENGENSENDDDIISESSENNTTLNESNTTTTKDNENFVNCEFYNRLIAEIKNTLKQQQHQHAKAHAHSHINSNNNNNNDCDDVNDYENNNYIDPIHVEELQFSAGESSTTLTTTPNSNTNNSSNTRNNSTKSRKLLLKNLENLKIILEKNESDSPNSSGGNQQGRPVQIEQWLAEIISETEIEPMLNSEILELSKIQSDTVTSTCGKSNASTS